MLSSVTRLGVSLLLWAATKAVYVSGYIVFQTAQENNFCHSGNHTDWILLSSSHVKYPSSL